MNDRKIGLPMTVTSLAGLLSRMGLVRVVDWNDGDGKSYAIHDCQLTRFDIPILLKEIACAQRKVNELSALASGHKARRTYDGCVVCSLLPYAPSLSVPIPRKLCALFLHQ